MTTTPIWVQLTYLAAAICFILALKGLSGPKTARRGNQLGAIGAVVATVVVFFQQDMDHLPLIIAAIAAGTVLGVVGAYKVQMTQMPQLVALFNGVGGGAAALVALLELHEILSVGAEVSTVIKIATVFTIFVGTVSFAGSMITFSKLQELMTTRPVIFPGLPVAFGGSIAASVLVAALGVNDPSLFLGIVLALLGLTVGVLLVLPVGGADVPIVISLLNAFTGLTVAAGGYVLSNTLLVVAGTLVGASGTMLTIAMAKGMGRSVVNTLFGALRAAPHLARAWRVIVRSSRSVPKTSGSCLLTPTASSSCPVMVSLSPRPSTHFVNSSRCSRRATLRSTTRFTRSPVVCPGT